MTSHYLWKCQLLPQTFLSQFHFPTNSCSQSDWVPASTSFSPPSFVSISSFVPSKYVLSILEADSPSWFFPSSLLSVSQFWAQNPKNLHGKVRLLLEAKSTRLWTLTPHILLFFVLKNSQFQTRKLYRRNDLVSLTSK